MTGIAQFLYQTKQTNAPATTGAFFMGWYKAISDVLVLAS